MRLILAITTLLLTACAPMSGKNSYGGYVGYRRFIASAKESTIFSTGNKHPEIDAAANTGIFSACGL